MFTSPPFDIFLYDFDVERPAVGYLEPSFGIVPDDFGELIFPVFIAVSVAGILIKISRAVLAGVNGQRNFILRLSIGLV